VTEPISLHGAIEASLPSVRALLPDGVTLRVECALVDGDIAVPAADVQLALAALVHNAIAAMPNGGVLTVRTEHVEAAGAELGPVPPLAPGRYMRVTVQDTGVGMDEAQRVRAIDAHDDESRGLAQVLGIVRRARGALWLDSATDLGTRAFLYLPLLAAPVSRRRTVLLAEDETAVRSVVRRMLLGQGFAVREARDGETALRIWQAEREHLVGVVTDIVMPVLGGRDLTLALRADDPMLPVLFISAYAGDIPELLEGISAPRQLLVKPFTNDAMLSALRALLADV
jgi:CheY-like chemotaxis protein